MTEETARAAVEEIRACKHDVEAAHGLEDDLYRDFVYACATRADRIGKLARILLETQDIIKTRWYA